MFRRSGASMREQGVIELEDCVLRLVQVYEFSSDVQRMSVIAQDERRPGECFVFSKGAPERIRLVCRQDSLPASFDQELDKLTRQGYRILAVAFSPFKEVGRSKPARDLVESELTFLGFLLFRNPLKAHTADVIAKLLAADCSVKIASGDHPLSTQHTASDLGLLGPAKEGVLIDAHGESSVSLNLPGGPSKIVEAEQFDEIALILGPADRLVMTGGAFEQLLNRKGTLTLLLKKTVVLARMKPEQKAKAILLLQESGAKTLMIGDGANDCAAIKQADVGISFSETDASHSAPFISLNSSIQCVLDVLCEARGTIVNNVEMFKYMLALSMVKFFDLFTLVFAGGNFIDGQYLYVNFVGLSPVLFTIGLARPSRRLNKALPPSNVLSSYHVVSYFSHVALLFLWFVSSYGYLRIFPGYVPPNPPRPIEVTDNYTVDQNVVFLTTNLAFMASISALVIGSPFKARLWRNSLLIGWIVCNTLYNAALFFVPALSIRAVHGMTNAYYDLPLSFRVSLFAINAAFFFVIVLFEDLVIKRVFLGDKISLLEELRRRRSSVVERLT
eukprot:TRINITY_DN5757_c0_g1_i3.p1 TRINITY_DN5757_c0_g1~~TRINITY_DN5757_c0_g1_i3.p1  ORF type:complete len:559 (-),score=113.28 TRINITY_DN5757_c0_g1_i3:116-1792(-)